MAKKTCVICGMEMGIMTTKFSCADGYICADCCQEAGLPTLGNLSNINLIETLTGQQLLEMRDKKRSDLSIVKEFKPTYIASDGAKFDDDNQQMIIVSKASWIYAPNEYTVFSYNQIVDFELIEDGESIVSGGLGRAAVGGVLFGGAGAIVGSVTGGKKSKGTCTQLRIKLTVNDYVQPVFFSDLITSETKKKSNTYKKAMDDAQKILSKLQLITASMDQTAAKEETKQLPTADPVEEIRKYKGLLDEGILTQEEFEAKKKQLLGL